MKLNSSIRNEILESIRVSLMAQPLTSSDPHESGISEKEYFKRQKEREDEIKARRDEHKVVLKRIKMCLTFYKDDEELQVLWPQAYAHFPQWCYSPSETINVPCPIGR